MNLKAARQALGWTQQELARKSGVAQQQISRLENKDFGHVSYLTVARLVRALRRAGLKGITAEELFPVPDDNGATK